MVRFADCLMVVARHLVDLGERCIPAGSSGLEEYLVPVLGTAWAPPDHSRTVAGETTGGTVPGAVGVAGADGALRLPVLEPGRDRAGDAGGGSDGGAVLAVPSRRRLWAEMASTALSVRMTRAGRFRSQRSRKPPRALREPRARGASPGPLNRSRRIDQHDRAVGRGSSRAPTPAWRRSRGRPTRKRSARQCGLRRRWMSRGVGSGR